MYFDGTGDLLTLANSDALRLSTGNWTIDGWIYPTGGSGYRTIISKRGGAVAEWELGIDPSNLLYFYESVVRSGSIVISNNQWAHFAATYDGTALRMFVNGVLSFNLTSSQVAATGTQPVYVGGTYPAGGQNYTGFLSNLRIIKGQALYTRSFVPPIAPAQPTPNTVLLLNGTSAAVTDATTKNMLETLGGAQVSTVSNRFGGSSMFFGTGGGAYAQTPVDQHNFGFGTGDFTIEMWINPTPGNAGVFFDTRRQTESRINMSLTNNNAGMSVSVSTTAIITVNTGITAGSWNYIAVTRASGSLRLFINGTQAGSTTTMTTDLGATGSLCLATAGDARGDTRYGYTGYIQDVRITRGVARYTANFTAPTNAFPTQ